MRDWRCLSLILVVAFVSMATAQSTEFHFHYASQLEGLSFTGAYIDPTMQSGMAVLTTHSAQGGVTKTYALEGYIGAELAYVDGGGVAGNITVVKPANGCSTITNPDEVNGTIALIERGSCPFVDKALNAQAAGATAVVVYNNMRDPAYILMGEDGTGRHADIPAVFIPQDEGQKLAAAQQLSGMVSYGGENSIRVKVTSSHETHVYGTVEFRLTALTTETFYYEDYVFGSYEFAGEFDAATGQLGIVPTEWIVWPVDLGLGMHLDMFGMNGTVGDFVSNKVVFFHGHDMPPFKSMFSLRQEPRHCGREIAAAWGCMSLSEVGIETETGDVCSDMSCTLPMDVQGYRIFNDEECADSGMPLSWFCVDSGTYTCASVLLTSAVPYMVTMSDCDNGTAPAGTVQVWPPSLKLSDMSQHNMEFSTSCTTQTGAPCAAGQGTGWEMGGEFVSSGLTPVRSRQISTLNVTAHIAGHSGQLVVVLQNRGNIFSIKLNGVQIHSLAYAMDWWAVEKHQLNQGTNVIEFTLEETGVRMPAQMPSAYIKSILIHGLYQGTPFAVCSACPAGTCSRDGVSMCVGCPDGFWSASGAGDCLPCSNPLPRYAEYAEASSSPTCNYRCREGYVMQTKAGIPSCTPAPNVCRLSAAPTPREKELSPSTSPEMLMQCLNMASLSPTVVEQTFVTLNTVAEMYPLSAWATARLSGKQPKDVLASIHSDFTSGKITKDWQLHTAIIQQLVRPLADPAFFYQSPQLYHDVIAYLPWKFSLYNNGGAKNGLYIDGLTAPAFFFGYERPTNAKDGWSVDASFDATQYIGWQVVQIDKGDPLAEITKFADTFVGFVPDANARLNLALQTKTAKAGDEWVYNYQPTFDNSGTRPVGKESLEAGQWTCTYSSRNLAVCGVDVIDTHKESIAFTLSDGVSSITVTIPLSILHTGMEAINADSAAIFQEQALPLRGPPGPQPPWWIWPPIEPTPFACHDEAMKLRQNPRFWPEVLSAADWAAAGQSGPFLDGEIAVLDVSTAVASLIFTSASRGKMGVIQLREFETEQFGVHTAILAFAAAGVTKVVVDVRGNVGGKQCHATQLAYLLAAKLNDIPYNQVAMDFSASPVMVNTIVAESAPNPQQYAGQDTEHPAWAKFGSWHFAELNGTDPTLDRNLQWTRETHIRGGPGLTPAVAGSWTGKVQSVCSDEDSIMEFNLCPGDEWSYTWTDDPEAGKRRMRNEKMLNLDTDSLIVLTDGRCIGACAVFLQLLQSNDAATVIGTGGAGGAAGAPSASTVSAASSVSYADLWCQWNLLEAQPSDYGNVNVSAYMPYMGQDVRFPVMETFIGGDAATSSTPTLYDTPTPVKMSLTPSVANRGLAFRGMALASLPTEEQSFETCYATGHVRPCVVEGGIGSQTCGAPSGGVQLYSVCSNVMCNAGWYAMDANTCSQVTMGTSVKQIEAILGQPTPEAAEARKEIVAFIEDYDKSHGDRKNAPHTGGMSKGGIAGLCIFMLFLGAALCLLGLQVHARGGFRHAFEAAKNGSTNLIADASAGIYRLRQRVSSVGGGAPGSRRGSASSARHIGNIESPMIGGGGPSTLPPVAAGQGGFLAQLSTRKSRGENDYNPDSPNKPMLDDDGAAQAHTAEL